MPLEIGTTANLLPLTLPANLTALVSPAENIVHGYNVVEQTCFHKTTVSNVIPGFDGLSASVKGIDGLFQAAQPLVPAAVALTTDVTAAVGLARTMLGTAAGVIGAVTGLVGTLTTLVGTVIGLVTTLIGSLGGIATACLAAGIATIVAGALFGFGFVGLGGIALTVLLAIVFFVVSSAVTTIATTLGSLNTAIGTLTAPLAALTGALGPLSAAITAVDGALSNPALPTDVMRSLGNVSTALTNLQNALVPGGPLANLSPTLSSTAKTLDDRAKALTAFRRATPAGQPKEPRAHLGDTYAAAVAMFNDAVTATRATSAVWDAMRLDTNNRWQIDSDANGIVDDPTLPCPMEVPEG
jgi:hypothetical protein